MNTVNTSRHRRPWTPEDQQRAEDLRAAGWRFCTIALALNRSPGNVRDRLARGTNDLDVLTMDGRPRCHKLWMPSDQLAAEALHADGLSFSAIARELGRERSVIRRNLERAGKC